MQRDLHLPLGLQLSMSLNPVNAIRFEQRGNTLCQITDNGILAMDHCLQVERNPGGRDAMRSCAMLQLFIPVRTFKQRLGGNTTGVKTGTTQCRLSILAKPIVYAGCPHSQLRTAYRSNIAGRSCTDNDHVIVIVHK
jgi:hypothetical protein